jgi:hypothetical protein
MAASSRFEQGKDDCIENIDDVCIHYDDGRVAANESLLQAMNTASQCQLAKRTGLHKEAIIATVAEIGNGIARINESFTGIPGGAMGELQSESVGVDVRCVR